MEAVTTTQWPSAGDGALRDRLLDLLEGVESWDDLERRHVAEAREWITSGAPVYRTAKPDVPGTHLVSYFVVIDADQVRALLVAHRKAGLLLPTGGHIEPMEDPWDAVRRECVEELGVEAVALNGFGERPPFVTITTTRGMGTHTDVSLWFVVHAAAASITSYDEEEFAGIYWLTPQEILAQPDGTLDPHMDRFTRKLCSRAGW
jgi:8-oxo-dGTP pyrophosphatase MutT (NUDIX family)